MMSKYRWIALAACCLFINGCGDSESSADVKQPEYSNHKQGINNGKLDNTHPEVVRLELVTSWAGSEPKTFTTVCTGVLVHPSWILTTSKCLFKTTYENSIKETLIEDKNFYADVNQHQYRLWDDNGNIVWRSAKDSADLVFVKIQGVVDSSHAKPAKVLPLWMRSKFIAEYDSGANPTGQYRPKTWLKPGVVYGYGRDENGELGKLKKAATEIIQLCRDYKCIVSRSEDSYPACDGSYRSSVMYGLIEWEAMSTKATICAPEDSGAPVYYTLGGEEYVAFVAYDSDRCCSSVTSYNMITTDSFPDEIAGLIEYPEICGNGLDDDGDGLIDDNDPDCGFCGNKFVNVGEDCDGNEFSKGKTLCTEWDDKKWASGSVSCKSDCTLDLSACKPIEYCGDGKLSSGEECDKTTFSSGITQCADYSFMYTGGKLTCTSDCKISTENCVSAPACGDGKVNGSEDCDGSNFVENIKSCTKLFPDLYESGEVTCANCQFDRSACKSWCGNGKVDSSRDEECDGDDFGGKTCESLVGKGSVGKLKCDASCSYIDTSNCSKPARCGDNVIDAEEECDLSSFKNGITTCAAYDGNKYNFGELSCNANCTLNTSQCARVAVCGDNKLDGDEVCDTTTFSGKKTSCKTLFPDLYSGGSVKCTDQCEYDTSDCIAWCGNGSINTSSGGFVFNEACDHGTNGDKFPTNANTCEKVVGPGSAGKLICSNDCKKIITSGCTEPAYCGDHIVNNDETCDGDKFKDGKSLCSDWSPLYDTGYVKCSSSCTIDFSGCSVAPKCGDGKINNSEECDGVRFKDDKNLCSELNSEYQSGRVTCNNDCTLNYDACQKKVVIPDEICDNKIDDDGDGKIDCEDTDCIADKVCHPDPVCGNGNLEWEEELCDGNLFLLDETSCHEWILDYVSGTVTCNPDCTLNFDNCKLYEKENCTNKIDDNGNNRIDCDDSDCIDDPACIADVDDKVVAEICDNKVDDDSNGKTDCDDPACINHESCKTASVAEICDNKVDDDNNGKTDCDDPACVNHESCKTAPVVEICDNKVDDDSNGKTDCDDPACVNHESCKTASVVEICDNKVDDDNNGKTDCDDPACAGDKACEEQGKENKESGCSAVPSSRPQMPLWLLIFASAGACLRRRKMKL